MKAAKKQKQKTRTCSHGTSTLPSNTFLQASLLALKVLLLSASSIGAPSTRRTGFNDGNSSCRTFTCGAEGRRGKKTRQHAAKTKSKASQMSRETARPKAQAQASYVRGRHHACMHTVLNNFCCCSKKTIHTRMRARLWLCVVPDPFHESYWVRGLEKLSQHTYILTCIRSTAVGVKTHKKTPQLQKSKKNQQHDTKTPTRKPQLVSYLC